MTSGMPINSHDAGIRLKGSINSLLREVQEHKNEILELKKEKSDMESNISKLTKKISRLTMKLNEVKSRQALLDELNLTVDQAQHNRNMYEPRTVPYRVLNIAEDERVFLNDIIDHGNQGIPAICEMVLHKPNCLQYLIDQFLQLNELVEHFSVIPKVLGNLSECFNLHSLIFKVYNDLPGHLNAEFCHYWVYDKINGEIWTLVIKEEEIRIKTNTGLYGYAISEGIHLNIKDCKKHPKFDIMVEEVLGHKFRSLMLMPVYDNDLHLLGLLECVNSTTGAFEHDDEFLVESFLPVLASITSRSLSKSAAIAIDRMKDTLISSSLAVFSCTSPSDLISTLEDACRSIFSVPTSRVLLYSSSSFLKLSDNSVHSIDSTIGISGKVLENRKPMVISSPYSSPLFNNIVDLSSTLPVIFYPLLSCSQSLGILQIPYKAAYRIPSSDISTHIDKDLVSILDQFSSMISATVVRCLSS
jgi:hypothetical protein